MAGTSPTHIPIPQNHADFERKAVVLFREVLKDPSVKRLGREGQEQFGVDLIGYRDEKISKIVGVQCKKKAPTSTLTEAQVREEVVKALKYSPKLQEYIIITSAKNDTALDQLAQKLSLQQAKKGRKIRIEVWGWGTLEELIDQFPNVRKTFDPGWSPALESVERNLSEVAQAMKDHATAAQVQGIAEQIQRQSIVQVSVLPAEFAEGQLATELKRIDRRRGFGEANTSQELAELAARVTAGSLANAPLGIRAEALERAARASLTPATLERAKRFHSDAVKLGLADPALYDALVLEAEGDPDKAIEQLARINLPQARAAQFNLISKSKGAVEALSWTQQKGYSFHDLGGAGCINLLLKRAEANEHLVALAEAESLPDEWLQDYPALRTIRASLLLATVLPSDQRGVLFQGLPINPRMLQFASITQTKINISKARADLEAARSAIQSLNLEFYAPYLDEQILWLRLEDQVTAGDARKQIEEDIKNPEKTLRRVRLALAYGIHFNRDALQRSLEARHELGQATADDQYALFLLAWFSQDEKKLADYFDAHRDEVFARQDLSREFLAQIEAEALTRLGRFADARTRTLAQPPDVLSEVAKAKIEVLIASVEQGNEAERIRALYEADKELPHLRLLVATLFKEKNFKELTKYAPILVEADNREEDYELAQKSLFVEQRYEEVCELAKRFPELHARHLEFAAVLGWSLFHMGRVLEARVIARQLVAQRHEPNDRELDVNTSIETGDWGHIQTVVAREIPRIGQLDAASLMRIARLAFECGSPYVDIFRDTAMAASPDKPEPYLAAYQLSVDRGEEYQESRSHEWLQRAVQLSGPAGPIQHLDLKDVIAKTSGWNERLENTNDLLAQGKIPLDVAARSLHRQPIELFVGVSKRNERTTNPKRQYPVLAFSGARGPTPLDGVSKIALDITTLYTLDHLNLLKKVLLAFDKVAIAPSTLSSLFTDRQFIRFRQPSEVAKARSIMDLIAKKRIKLINSKRLSVAESASLDMAPDLHQLLNTAQEYKAIVVRSAPVHKLRSLLEETVDMNGFATCITDIREVLKFLKGKVTKTVALGAQTYIEQVDKGWDFKSRKITKQSVVYLDDLAVTYLHHVGLLEALTQEVAGVYVHQEVESHYEAVIRGSEASDDLLSTVERIRANLNSAIERGSVTFTSRRYKATSKEDQDDITSKIPSLDIMADLSQVELVVCDDRFLIHEGRWSDGTKSVPCATSLDLIQALNSRGHIPETQISEFQYRLRSAGYHPVPINADELQRELNRAEYEKDKLIETPELTATRRSLTIAYENRAFISLEVPWVVHVRTSILQVLRALWTEKRFTGAIIARSNWLLDLLPWPRTWVDDPADGRAWSDATQATVGMLQMLLTSPFSRMDMEERYGNWIEERILGYYRTAHPQIYQAALKFVARFFRELIETSDTHPREVRLAVVKRLVHALSSQAKKDILAIDGFADAVGVSLRNVLALEGFKEVDLNSFFRCMKAALEGKPTCRLVFADGTRVKVSTFIDKSGAAVVELEKQKLRFMEAAVLDKSARKRASSLTKMFKERPLLPKEEKDWHKALRLGALRDDDFMSLSQALRETPESFVSTLSKPKNLNGDNMVPQAPSYYERLVGPLPTANDFNEYADDVLKSYQEFLLAKGAPGVRRLAYSCISARVVPVSAIQSNQFDDIAKLLNAQDPFSLLFGFESCVELHRAGDRRAVRLGRRFLERLFENPDWLKSRCELFSACAIITGTRLRRLAHQNDAPLYWTRLAAFAQAGVLTNGLSHITNTSGFLKWALEGFSGTYTWDAVPDVYEEPRWDSEWVAPEALRAEIVGRCFNAIGRLGKRKGPTSWRALMEKAWDVLDPKLTAFFPGPLDGFTPTAWAQRRKEDIEQVEQLLKQRVSFKDAPGLNFIAYSGGVDSSHIGELLRMLEGSNQLLASPDSARQILSCCSYVAATTRSIVLAQAVVERSLRLITAETPAAVILSMMLHAMKACGAYEDLATYFKEIGKVATRFAYASPRCAAQDLISVMNELCERQPKMMGALGRAKQLLTGELLAA